jgi:hypothetical protein
MNGNPSEAADWISRSMSPRARDLQTIREYCRLMSTNHVSVDAVPTNAR